MTTPFNRPAGPSTPDIFDLDIRVLPAIGEVPDPRQMPTTTEVCTVGCHMTRGCTGGCSNGCTYTCAGTCGGTGNPCAC